MLSAGVCFLLLWMVYSPPNFTLTHYFDAKADKKTGKFHILWNVTCTISRCLFPLQSSIPKGGGEATTPLVVGIG